MLRDDGSLVAHDDLSGRSWRITPALASLLDAIRTGWQPGEAIPASVSRYLPDTTSSADLLALCADLVGKGLLESVAPSSPAGSRTSWHDIRLARVRLQPPSTGVTRVAVAVALIVPVTACVLGASVFAHRSEDLRAAITHNYHAGISTYGLAAEAFVGLLTFALLKAVHEFGHAMTLAGSSRQPVELGIRLASGFPQAYTDAKLISVISRRASRLGILLAGVSAELLVWLCVIALLSAGITFPAIVPLGVLLYTPPLSMLGNLVPVIRNDGYFILQELTGQQNLARRGDISAAAEFFGDGQAPSSREASWVVWFGLTRIIALPFLGAVAGVAAGLILGRIRIALAIAGVIGGGMVGFRRVRHASAPSLPI